MFLRNNTVQPADNMLAQRVLEHYVTL